jgi:lipoate-protein ligase A
MNHPYMYRWRYIDSGSNLAARNMAVDEELLARAQAGEKSPVLRLYTWDPPAVSLGRFQKLESAVDADACKRLGFDIVRRITGGRAVLHYHELTYSIVAPLDCPLFPPTVLGTYRVIAAGLLAGLRNLNIMAEMVSRGERHSPLVKNNAKEPSCFSSSSWYEIVVKGRKIVGSAQRRMPNAFLQHGSILINYDPKLEALVIPGGGTCACITSIQEELGNPLPLAEIKQAFRLGFQSTFGVLY